MTREEAIKALTKERKTALHENKQAFDVAIKALEQLPKLQNRCFALTQGQLCMFCPFDCEYRKTEYRSKDK